MRIACPLQGLCSDLLLGLLHLVPKIGKLFLHPGLRFRDTPINWDNWSVDMGLAGVLASIVNGRGIAIIIGTI